MTDKPITLEDARAAVSEMCRLQYGQDPKNVDAVIVKHAKMRADRIKFDEELSEPHPQEEDKDATTEH